MGTDLLRDPWVGDLGGHLDFLAPDRRPDKPCANLDYYHRAMKVEAKKLKARRRALYSYACRGGCGKKRTSLIYLRATDQICRKCRRGAPPPNQPSLFQP